MRSLHASRGRGRGRFQWPLADFPRSMATGINLPQELFYQFALYLPSTKDVLTFALTHSCVRKTLLTPVLFKERLALRWDLSAWKDAEDDNAAASPPRYLERWMRIDYIYCRTIQLFDEASVGNYFLKRVPVDGGTRVAIQQLDPKSQDDIAALHLPDQGVVPHNPLLDEQKAIVWLRKLSEVLPPVLTHHRAFSGALLRHVLLKNIASFLVFRWGKYPANHRSKIPRRHLDLREGIIFHLQHSQPKACFCKSFRVTTPYA